MTANEVHVWRIPLDQNQDTVWQFRSFLSGDEIERADRFYFERDRRRFTVARTAMRQILGRYLDIAPQKLVFSYSAKGKPELSPDMNALSLKFNLSHSGELALLAVAQEINLGIDVESMNARVVTGDIAGRYFSAQEVATLFGLAAIQRTKAFFRCWTRKEAYVKALGEGLSFPLDAFSVAFAPDVPAALLWVENSPEEVSRWRLYHIDVHEDYQAALVSEGKEHHLRHWHWIAKP